MRVVTIWSHTHYGRGTPHTNEENRQSISLALAALEFVVPGLSTYGHVDEDYGWVVPIDADQEKALRDRFPASHEEHNIVYLHNHGEYADMLTIPTWVETAMVTICDHRDAKLQGEPIGRTFDAMYQDWFEMYGRW